jgi:hypothetical protein
MHIFRKRTVAYLLRARTVKPTETAVVGNGFVNTVVAGQWHSSRYVLAPTHLHATIEELLEAMFSMRCMLRLYITRKIAKQGSAHHWKFTKVHTGQRFEDGFQPSIV